MIKVYRKNVAVVVLNDEGMILACERVDKEGIWQLPQGGWDVTENLETAMKRELQEEIGTDAVEVIDQLPNPIRYDWPEELYSRGYHGQEQYYFLVRMRPDAHVQLDACSVTKGGGHADPEFKSFEWVVLKEFLKRLKGFKVSAYNEALAQFVQRNPGTIAE